MGWLWLLLIASCAFAILWRAGVSGALAWISATALTVGAAGYAWQQHAFLPGHTVRAEAEAMTVEPGFVAFRTSIMPGAKGDDAVLAAADDRLRAGDPTGAAQLISDAIDKRPGDAALWAGLGGAIATHDGGQLSPAAKFAFARSIRLAPDQPGPLFMLGLALIQSGDVGAAKTAWLRALALSPQNASYRVAIAEQLVMIDQFIAMQAQQPASRTGG